MADQGTLPSAHAVFQRATVKHLACVPAEEINAMSWIGWFALSHPPAEKEEAE